MLVVIEAVLSVDEVQQWREHLAQGSWQDGAQSAGPVARRQKRNQQIEEGSPLAIELGNQLLRRLGSHGRFVSAALPNRIYPPRFNRYRAGEQYGTHVDNAVMRLPGSTAVMRTDLSATLFLSDPETYEGGVLEVETGFGVQGVKLAAGSLVLYPASSLHRVTPVSAGERLASFFWVESLVGDDSARRDLYDLDQALQALTQRLTAVDPQVVALSAVYHNLLRRHARC
jgi:PKHD-type hydroxylase